MFALCMCVSPGKPLSPEVLSKTLQGCDMALQLEDDKQAVRKRHWHTHGPHSMQLQLVEGTTGASYAYCQQTWQTPSAAASLAA